MRPFRGDSYGRHRDFDLSILVLGESSFNKEDPRRGEPLPLDWNKRIIDCVFRRKRDNTITRAVGVFYGEWRSFEQRMDFWTQSAFANFVQTDLGGSGVRPSEQEWQTGREPFLRYLSELKPEFVLALGKELWEHLPEPFRKEEVARDGEKPDAYLYWNGGGCSFVFGIDHPAYRGGWSYTKWSPRVKNALKLAREIRDAGTCQQVDAALEDLAVSRPESFGQQALDLASNLLQGQPMSPGVLGEQQETVESGSASVSPQAPAVKSDASNEVDSMTPPERTCATGCDVDRAATTPRDEGRGVSGDPPGVEPMLNPQ